ncbi:MAG: acyclic terpene utilization AtuA family protein [Acetobacteraceae bacterium]|nr:acyclic terpene utilization AtuA family protein [Acetobacteraceae bacterium]MSP29422.1 acyclic terpene utilization AtuA family protein [Acetobacteraceae bacterium]
MARDKIRIGCGAGFSDDRIPPGVEIVEKGDLDYLAMECLAERAIAHETLDRTKDPTQGLPARNACSRGGQILGFQKKSAWPAWDALEALVSAAELPDLIIDFRSQTMGLGSYVHQFDHLSEVARQPA